MSHSLQPAPLLPILVPELGTQNEPLRVCTWLVDEEETIEAGERLVEVLIPGVTFSINSPAAGKLVKIECPAHCPIQPGDTLAWIEPVPSSD